MHARRDPLELGTTLDVATVLWCTGFRPDTGRVDVVDCDARRTVARVVQGARA